MVVVTGASGHLGANLVRALLERGERVRVLVHKEARSLDGLDVERVPGDITAPETLGPAFAGADVVVHLAALISVTGSQSGAVERLNVDGARSAARAAREAGVRRYVHVSSVHAWRHAPDLVLTEDCPRAGPGDPAYDRSKAAGEEQVREEVRAGLDAVIVNPSGVIGPCDYGPSRMGRSLLMLARGHMPAVVDGGFDWVDARDVANSIVAAMTRGRVGESYLLGGRWGSIAEIAALVARARGRTPVTRVSPRWLTEGTAGIAELAQRAVGIDPFFTSEALHAVYNGSRHVNWNKAERDLGHAARPLEETIQDTVRWFTDAGRLA